MKKTVRKSKTNRNRKKGKKGNIQKRSALLVFVVLIILIAYSHLNNSQRYQDRQIELSFAYFYCANKIIELERTGEYHEMEYYYEIAKEIEQKLDPDAGIQPTKKKMEKAYWANQE